ncbi:SRPBCC family protein [Geminicoccus roseus]|uniref:SRPBCC family protein n=1 Tax=Geminicoccus roseus TaxID=404900 RepID=UPI0004135E09|nr:SRPBCC domain-containing protein [Geminicoccus roseus]
MAAQASLRDIGRPECGLRLIRHFPFARARIFEAWTRPVLAMRWWGPNGYIATVCSMDPRPQGTWRACLRSPEGVDHWMRGRFCEITAPGRLSFTLSWIENSQAGPETLVEIDLDDRQEGTRMTFRQAPFESIQLRDAQRDGWAESFDRLEDHCRHG